MNIQISYRIYEESFYSIGNIGIFAGIADLYSTKLTDIASTIGISDPASLTDNVQDLIDYGLIFQILDVKVFSVMMVLGFSFTVTLVGGLHMLIEKLFYKKFYEEPKVWPALRRGIILFLVIGGILFFRLIGGLMWQNAILIIILGIVLELLFIKFTDNRN